MKIEEIEVEKLIPYEFNNKIHGEEQINRIANSIKEFGFLQPIVIDKKNFIIVGHGRLAGAKKLGLEKVPCIRAEDLTEKQIKKYRILDNKLNESERDYDNLKLELDDLGDLDIGDIKLDISDVFPDLGLDDEEETEIEEDEAPEVSQEAKVVRGGDLFMLGNHRLLCGDSVKVEDIELLMDGKQSDMVFTDPPYLMGFEGNVHADGSKSFNAKFGAIKNDKMSREDGDKFVYDIFNTIAVYNKGAYYVCFYRLGLDYIFRALDALDNKYKALIIWNKQNHTLSNSDYMSKYEPIVYGWFGEHNFYGDRSNFDIWDIKRTKKNDLHPTMKPIELVGKAIRNSSKKDEIVLDLFGGSGSTLIACEQLNRKCYMMELDPKYIEVIIKRYHNLNPNAEIKCINRDLDLTPILK